MARIRTIKPEFWTDGAIVKLSAYARLMFLGALNFTMCDYGHLPDDPMRLKLQVLPMDDVDPDALIHELLKSGRWVRLQGSEGRSYLHVKRFTDHQKVDKRWSPRCVACNDPAIGGEAESSPDRAATPPASPDHAETPPVSPQDRTGQEGKGKEEKTSSSPEHDDAFEAFWKAYPRKVDKKPARQSWDRAIKGGTDAQTIIEAAKRYAATRAGEPEKFTKHAKTWLNQESWTNYTGSDRHLRLVDELSDDDINPDEVLGQDYWTPPAPPREVTDAGHEARQNWLRGVRAERRQERVAEARRVLARRAEGTA